MDREKLDKIIKALNCCIYQAGSPHACKGCPYQHLNHGLGGCTQAMRLETFELLTESLQVVRCKDCKHVNTRVREQMHCELDDWYYNENHFCERGEQKIYVRCKDCKYYNLGGIDSEGKELEGYCRKPFHSSKGKNWFCWDGKLRE